MIGRLVHYGADAVLISCVLAGVKRTTGFTLSPSACGIPEGTATGLVNSYLGVGEGLFDYACATSYRNGFFVREPKSSTKS
ncbi:hypothetical protein E5Q_00140 [Mixia osmundae IAM 14324]|uniref:DUF1748-domain-containing protein n=1 Tax=Mixia osmundae (strain CBS 9802 / IAM 14324 / JCM 22182 / KY 12970) TaxID=764103 RepID=G7DSD8_MIXOS|nr:hypothetical protein E5Q_00140 [Mixia osmundae IAM 14324]